ncbi:MAG: hypothetical protein JO285_04485, partial [Kutzneria sp.]|nr:hypothetical protein [Kutzneria sp.]
MTAVRKGARMVDLAWLTWRQHRWTIVVTAFAVAGYSAYLLVLRGDFVQVACRNAGSCLNIGPAPQILVSFLLPLVSPVLAGIVGLFWGAPLLAREYEQRTHMLSWTQDVSSTRWLLTRLALLGSVVTVLSAGYGIAGTALVRQIVAADHGRGFGGQYGPFTTTGFELWPPMQVVYALFGLALGVAISAVTRRTVMAMGVTLAAFIAARVLIAVWARPIYLPPMRSTFPIGERQPA